MNANLWLGFSVHIQKVNLFLSALALNWSCTQGAACIDIWMEGHEARRKVLNLIFQIYYSDIVPCESWCEEVFQQRKRWANEQQITSSVKPPLWSLTNIKCVVANINAWCGRHIAWCKEDLYWKLGIFILPIVSDWTNVFIVTWLSYAEEELTFSLALAPDWLTKH